MKETNDRGARQRSTLLRTKAAASTYGEQEQACDDASPDDDGDGNANVQEEKAVSNGDSSPVKLDVNGEEELSNDWGD